MAAFNSGEITLDDPHGTDLAPEPKPFEPVPETESPEQSQIVVFFPKGVHSTELAISYENVDINQMLLAQDSIGQQRRIQIEQLEEMARQPIKRGIGGLFDPRSSHDPRVGMRPIGDISSLLKKD